MAAVTSTATVTTTSAVSVATTGQTRKLWDESLGYEPVWSDRSPYLVPNENRGSQTVLCKPSNPMGKVPPPYYFPTKEQGVPEVRGNYRGAHPSARRILQKERFKTRSKAMRVKDDKAKESKNDLEAWRPTDLLTNLVEEYTKQKESKQRISQAVQEERKAYTKAEQAVRAQSRLDERPTWRLNSWFTLPGEPLEIKNEEKYEGESSPFIHGIFTDAMTRAPHQCSQKLRKWHTEDFPVFSTFPIDPPDPDYYLHKKLSKYKSEPNLWKWAYLRNNIQLGGSRKEVVHRSPKLAFHDTFQL